MDFSTKRGITVFIVGICLLYYNTPVHSARFGHVKSLLGKKFDHHDSFEEAETEENCQRLPPRYSNASGSLQFAHFDLLSLLKHGTDIIDQTKYIDKATLILGNTGSGKTTISQILSGKLHSLHAVLTQSDRLVIIDDAFKISGPSTTSKTLIPELVVLEEEEEEENDSLNYLNATTDGMISKTTTTTFYDCPGFDDTRGPEEDLAASFFMNHIVRRKVNQLKMLFLVIHSSVKMGNDRLDFDMLASHATRFVKNLQKYQNSIGLVVTKVNSFNARGRYIPDKTIQKEIIEFLQVYVENMRLKLTNPKITSEERTLTENKIKFVTILLQRNKNGEYSKITFSRDPEKCGPLSESQAVAQNRDRILALTKDELEFTPANYSDFGYTLKDSTTLSMHRISQNVNKEIASSIENIISSFENWMETVKFSSKNLTDTLDAVERTLLNLSKLVENLQNHLSSNFSSVNSTTTATTVSINVVEIAKLFTRTLRKIGYHVSSKVEYFMERQQAYIEFFEADDTTKILETWMDSIRKLQERYESLQSWCTFCQNVEEKMSLYSFQNSISKNGLVNNIENRNASSWLSVLEKQTNFPVPAKLKELAENFNGSKREHFEKTFIEIMEFATKINQIQCNGTTIYVLGNFVRVSEFADKLSKNTICSGIRRVKRLEVYASHTIFIDADISAEGRELNLVFIAPNWHVIGQKYFNLQGNNASGIYPEKAKSGREFYGEDGTNGIPGIPGGPGGALFGVAGKVTRDTDRATLYVNLNGGNGGRGQDGGDGGNGLDGRSTAYGSNYRENRDVNVLWLYVKDRTEYDGYSGTPGGNGGFGGFGGNPGLPGQFTVNILEREESSAEIIQHSRKEGNFGETGQPGKAGEGGKPGNGMTCTKSRFLVFSSGPSCQPTTARAPRGKSGFSFWDIFNTDGEESAKRPEYSVVKWQSLLKFKQNFYQENVETTQQFMKLIDTNTHMFMGDFTNQINFFVGEFEFLERQSKLLSVDSMLSLYNSFIKKVEVFSERVNFIQDKKTTNLLLAGAHGKLATLKQSNKSLGFVLDIQGYLSNVKTQLEDYSFRNLTVALNNIQKKYETHVHKKADSLNEFMEHLGAPSIVNADRDLDQRFTALEKKLKEIFNSTAAEVNGTSWENIKWQMKKDKDVQEALELLQVYQIIPLLVDVTNFLVGEETLNFLTNQQDSRKNGLLNNNGTQSLIYSTSINGSNAAEIYLGQHFSEQLASDFPDKKDQIEKLLELVQLLAQDAHEKRVNVEQSVQSLVSSITNHLMDHYHGEKLEEGTLWNVASQHWQVKMHLFNVKHKLAALIEGVDSQVYLNVFDRIQLVLTMITNLYDNIDQYQNIKILADYLKNNMQGSRSSSQVDKKLEKVIGESILEREYQKALHAFRQWIFPFAKLYKSKSAPKVYTFEQAQNYYVKQVEMLEADVVGRNETTSRIYRSGALHKGDFYTEPFFLWENSRWGKEIRDLLSGKRVTLNANIRNAACQKNAVKFHWVELNFKVKGGADLDELNTLLENFRVTLVHGHVSFYKYNNQFYVMTGNNLTIQYNFVANSSNIPKEESTDEVYILQSPYTLWTMQLELVGSGTGQEIFENLQKWAKIVDLELVGTGFYVDDGYRLEVDEYYERDNGIILGEDFQFGSSSTESRVAEKYIESKEEDSTFADDYYIDLTPVPQ